MRPNIIKKRSTDPPRVFIYKNGKESVLETTSKSGRLKQRRLGKRAKRQDQW